MKSSLRIPAALPLTALCAVGLGRCGSPVETGDPEASLAGALTAVTVLEQTIEGGATAAASLHTLAQTLQGTPDVAEVLMEDNQDTLWVSYRSGLVHGFAVVDEEDEDRALGTPLQPAQLAAPADASRAKPRTASAARSRGPAGADLAQANGAGSCAAYGIPANNKAVIANSLTVSQPLQDYSSPLKAMLAARGYDVRTVDADLDFFKRLTEFGVIVHRSSWGGETLLHRAGHPRPEIHRGRSHVQQPGRLDGAVDHHAGNHRLERQLPHVCLGRRLRAAPGCHDNGPACRPKALQHDGLRGHAQPSSASTPRETSRATPCCA